MNISPKVSVIVPIYGVAQYLRKCIDSILAQSLDDIEIILVNDCSPDPLEDEICKAYRNQDNRVIYLKNETNVGQGESRNRGIKIAKGDYIGFVDGDDYIHPDMYKVMYERAVEEGLNVIQCNDLYVDINEKEGGSFHSLKQDLQLNTTKNIVKTYLSEQIINAGPCLKLCKKEFLLKQKIEFPTGIYYEDYLFTLKILLSINKLIVLKDKLYYYYQRPNSTSRGLRKHNVTSWFKSIDLMFEVIKNNDICYSHFYKFSLTSIVSYSVNACLSNFESTLVQASRNSIFVTKNKDILLIIRLIIFFKKMRILLPLREGAKAFVKVLRKTYKHHN